MDTRLFAAGIAMALGLTLFIPTFNALNNSYVENVQPPPWVPEPDEIPPITPPPDFEPPEDREIPEDWELPPDYEGPVPPACPPPVVERIEETSRRYALQPALQWSQRITFAVPDDTLALVGFVNVTDWDARSVAATLVLADGSQWSQDEQGQSTLVGATNDDISWGYNSYNELDGASPPHGEYVLELEAQFPLAGDFETEFGVVLPCGGLLHE